MGFTMALLCNNPCVRSPMIINHVGSAGKDLGKQGPPETNMGYHYRRSSMVS